MITRLVATRYDRIATSGKTQPILAAATDIGGDEIEIVLKLSGNCERGVNALALEIFGACLASGVGLPVPEPFIVDVKPGWSSIITEPSVRDNLARSSAAAFGSRRVGTGFSTWPSGMKINSSSIQIAAGIFAFDAFTQNPDRRSDNPNLLVRGDELRIIDHELTFAHKGIVGWREPWIMGSLKQLEQPGAHVLSRSLHRAQINWAPIRASWTSLRAVSVRFESGGVAGSAEL